LRDPRAVLGNPFLGQAANREIRNMSVVIFIHEKPVGSGDNQVFELGVKLDLGLDAQRESCGCLNSDAGVSCGDASSLGFSSLPSRRYLLNNHNR
jgi:hypothetical protein